MADTAPTDKNDSTEEQKDAGKAPDWTEETFDAERAKRLVANLRAEVAELKSENGTLKTERDNLKAATGSESDKVKAAEKEAADARRELWIERALRKHPELDEDLVEFLSGETEDEIAAKAERLAKIGKKDADSSKDEKDDAESGDDPKPDEKKDELPGKPQPDLRPGHGGEPNEPFDPEAIAREVRSSSF